jgi:hypothetical protein
MEFKITLTKFNTIEEYIGVVGIIFINIHLIIEHVEITTDKMLITDEAVKTLNTLSN